MNFLLITSALLLQLDGALQRGKQCQALYVSQLLLLSNIIQNAKLLTKVKVLILKHNKIFYQALYLQIGFIKAVEIVTWKNMLAITTARHFSTFWGLISFEGEVQTT